MIAVLVVAIGTLAALSILVSPRVRSSESFFRGMSGTGRAPGLWPLVVPAVSTLDFALSGASELAVVELWRRLRPWHPRLPAAAAAFGGLKPAWPPVAPPQGIGHGRRHGTTLPGGA
jgi:hypothetical protein